MKIEDLRDFIDVRLEQLETKLDNHLERIAKAETAIEWMRGHLKITTTVFITIATAAVLAALNLKG